MFLLNLLSFVVKTIIFGFIVLYVALFVFDDGLFVPDNASTYKPKVNTQGGLIVPEVDTRTYY